MTRRCELMGTLPLSGQRKSHAENKTKRKFRPNLCNVTLISDVLGKKVRLRVSARAFRTMSRAAAAAARRSAASSAGVARSSAIRRDSSSNFPASSVSGDGKAAAICFVMTNLTPRLGPRIEAKRHILT